MYPIAEIQGIDLAFGPRNCMAIMPKYEEIPEDFKKQYGNKWVDLFNDWFFVGLKNLNLTPKSDVDQNKALAHIKAIMASFEPQHEHKTAACAFLFAEWFEDASWEKVAAAKG